MPQFRSERKIAADPDAIFELLEDGVRLLELESEPEGAPLRKHVAVAEAAPGVYEVTLRMGGSEQVYPVTRETEEPARRIAYLTPAMRVAYELEPQPEGALLRCSREYDTEHGGLIGKAGRKFGLDDHRVRGEIDAHLDAISLALKPAAARQLTEAGGYAISELVDAPPSVVFAFVADLANMPGWTGKGSEIEHRAGARVGAGAQWRLTLDPEARLPETTDYEVLEYEPGRQVAIETKEWAVNVYSVAPAANGGTALTLEVRPERQPGRFLGRLRARARFVPERVIPAAERKLEAIKRAIEA